MRMHGCGHRGRDAGLLGEMLMTGFGRGFGRGFGHGFGRGWSFDGGGEPGGRGGHGGPRGSGGSGGRGRMFGTGELRLMLLGLIAEAPRHGYELIKAIDELSGGQYAPSPGVVYPTLSLLADEGLVEDQAGAGSRKSFAVTEAGQAELTSRRPEYEAVSARIKSLAEEGERRSAPPVNRALGNLHTAVRGRLAAGEVGRETIHQIAELLDEAARKIERL